MGRGRSTAARILSRKVGLPPIARPDARVLILGSLPGDASLSAAQYYAHPRNHFWSLVSNIAGADLTIMEYPARIASLQTAGIALWDVIGEANRHGSLDQKIRDARANDLRGFVDQLPDLRAVAFNGKKAAALAVGMFDGLPVDIIHLPSSSPAYTIGAVVKGETWAMLAQYLEPLEHRVCITI